jgi:Lipase (class 3)
MPAPTLDGRLLCACGASYAIKNEETTLAPDPTSVYLAGAGFVRPPTVITAGPREIDACLVGELADGLVIVFRGTLPLDLHSVPTVRDWLGDFDADPIKATGFPGLVHEGFFGALSVLSASITAEVARQMAGKPAGRPVLITGHSKGGAVAALAAWSLHSSGTAVKVVTFASAKPGDAGFHDAYEAAGIDHTRYEYDNDIVPHLPLSTGGFIDVLSSLPRLPGLRDPFDDLRRFDYQPVGTLQYIDHTGRIVPEDHDLRAERDLSLALAIIRGRLSQIASDHAIGCGSGYMSAVAPVGVCS